MAKKFSQFPFASSISPGDSVVGLKDGANTRFSIATVFSYIQALFVPTSRKVNNKALSSDITLDASDVGAVGTEDVGVADGVASLDSTGKVPSSQLPPISSDAEDITYDPTTSGLTATNVQDAIDEVYGDIPSQASDIGAQDEITASGILKGDGAGGVTAAVAGTDYQAPLTAGTDYATPAQLADKANQSQLAYVESGTTASQNYYVGQYFALGGKTYQATTPISIGESFTENVNCKVAQIADHLIDMTSNISLVSMEYGSGVMGINLRMKDGTLRLLEVYDNGQPELRLRTFNGSAWSTAWSVVADLDSPFHASAVMEGLVNCNSCSTPLEVYQILKASPNATGYGTIGDQQTSQLKTFLSNPYLNYTNVTFQFVSTGLIRCTARNSSDGTALGKVCYLKGLINNLAVAANWSVTPWDNINGTIEYKEVTLTTATLGTSFSPTSRLIGSVSTLFGVAAEKILSIIPRDNVVSPASNLVCGFYAGYFYLAATQACTLSSSVKFNITYIK